MDVGKWTAMAEELSSSLELRSLTDDQLRAFIDLLALTIHADSKVSPVEVAGFNHLFFDLEWASSRSDIVKAHIPVAAGRAAVDGDVEKGIQVVRHAAAHLGAPSLRLLVFRVAASLAAVDMRVVLRENTALGWIAEAFELSDGERDAIIRELSSP